MCLFCDKDQGFEPMVAVQAPNPKGSFDLWCVANASRAWHGVHPSPAAPSAAILSCDFIASEQYSHAATMFVVKTPMRC